MTGVPLPSGVWVICGRTGASPVLIYKKAQLLPALTPGNDAGLISCLLKISTISGNGKGVVS